MFKKYFCIFGFVIILKFKTMGKRKLIQKSLFGDDVIAAILDTESGKVQVNKNFNKKPKNEE